MNATVCAPSIRRLLIRVQVVSILAVAGLAAAPMSHAETPSYTAAQAKRGAALYAGACALCHGETVDGGEFGPALKGPAHAAYWNGRTLKDMLEHMKLTMPPTQPGLLGDQGFADVLAFLLEANGAAPGKKEIPADGTGLQAFSIK